MTTASDALMAMLADESMTPSPASATFTAADLQHSLTVHSSGMVQTMARTSGWDILDEDNELVWRDGGELVEAPGFLLTSERLAGCVERLLDCHLYHDTSARTVAVFRAMAFHHADAEALPEAAGVLGIADMATVAPGALTELVWQQPGRTVAMRTQGEALCMEVRDIDPDPTEALRRVRAALRA